MGREGEGMGGRDRGDRGEGGGMGGRERGDGREGKTERAGAGEKKRGGETTRRARLRALGGRGESGDG